MCCWFSGGFLRKVLHFCRHQKKNHLVIIYSLHPSLNLFCRAAHGRDPTAADLSALQDILLATTTANNYPADSAVLSPEDLLSLSSVAGTCSVLAASVLGSYLSQEVVKAVSMAGEPAFNVFVFSAADFEAKAFPVR